MEADQWDHVEALFAQARAVPADERADFLRTHCDDRAVRAEVASLLDAREEAPGFFEAAAEQVVAPALDEFEGAGVPEGREREALDLAGQHVGAYRLVEEIGVGGMSVVYRAERARGDYERTVAVKLLQRRLHTEAVEERFRAERQVLASLDHPNIAGLIDGGVTEGGRPYLVMEYVDGVPLTTHADERELGLEARLDLLGQVAEAVQAAHRQLVVHRDLKPTNVLVTETESDPQVKLLDFGIAKLMGEALPVTRPETRTGQHLLTPAYAAPEQVAGDEITTATDVYQLGVLAYELLSGTRPFDLAEKSLTEIERILMEEEPQSPSEAAERFGDRVRGDLDRIVLKALRKEPERRYRSVEALAVDLDRYRAGEPVEARPATLGYRAKKFVSRNRTAVGAGVLIVFLGIAYAATVTVQANRLAEQRNRARTEAETAEQVTAFLTDLFEATRPSEARGDTITARELLAQGLNRAKTLDEQPAVRAQILNTISTTYRSLGEYDQAEQIARRAVSLDREVHGKNSPQVAEGLGNQGRILRRKGEYELADSLFRAALEIKQDNLGTEHPSTAQTLNDLGLLRKDEGEHESADSLFRKALTIRREQLGINHRLTARTLNNLAILLREQGEYAAADSMYRQALAIQQEKLGAEHPTTLETMHNLGVVLSYRGQHAAADSTLREVLAVEREQMGTEHPSVATTMSTLGLALTRKGDYPAADSMYREALQIRRKQMGSNHPSVATTLNNLAVVLWHRGKYAAVDSVYREVLAIRRSQLAPTHPDVATTLNNLGAVLRERGKYATADSVLQEAISIRREQLGENHSRTATSLYNRAQALARRREYASAERLFQEALSIRRSHFEDGHGEVQEVAADLVSLYETWGRPEEGQEYQALAEASE